HYAREWLDGVAHAVFPCGCRNVAPAASQKLGRPALVSRSLGRRRQLPSRIHPLGDTPDRLGNAFDSAAMSADTGATAVAALPLRRRAAARPRRLCRTWSADVVRLLRGRRRCCATCRPLAPVAPAASVRPGPRARRTGRGPVAGAKGRQRPSPRRAKRPAPPPPAGEEVEDAAGR